MIKNIALKNAEASYRAAMRIGASNKELKSIPKLRLKWYKLYSDNLKVKE